MKRLLSAILCVGLWLLFISASPPDTKPAVTSTCDITIRGQHGGSTGSILLDFNLSEVRNATGWWTQLGVGEYGYDQLTLEPGRVFSEVFARDFGCNARRRYRLHLTATVDGSRYEYVHYYPSDDGYTRETVIDLGDVSRFFDAIEPGPPISSPPSASEPTEGPAAALNLDGEWIRRESNNDPNDGMRITVSGGQAVLTFVPPTASANWHEGEVLWRNIGSDGTLEVLGSNDAYYDAEMIAQGANIVHIDIDANGRGNDQSWERGQPVSDEDSGEESDVENVEIAEACADHLRLDPAVAAIVDPIAEALMVEQEIVGMAVGVVQGGAITHLKGYGYQDRENGTPVTWQTRFRWASISKTLTAVAALSLVDDGALELADDIRDLVPEFPAKPEGTITLRHVLSNTSGVRHYDSLDVVNHPHRTRAATFSRDLPYDPVAAVSIFGDAPLIAPVMSPPFAPGRRYHYTTFGFILAGAGVERAAEEAADMSYTEFIQDRIADPLCMDSLAPDEPGHQSDHETRRYRKDDTNAIVRLDADEADDDDSILWKLPGGGYQSNIRDLALFARGLMERELLDETTHALQEMRVRASYGLGIYTESSDHDGNNATPETRRIGHGGDDSSFGVRASMYFYPDHDLGIVLLINSSQAARGRILSRLANALGAPWRLGEYRLPSALDCDQNDQTATDVRFAGIWRDGPADQLLRQGYPVSAFTRERERLREHGYHLTDLEAFTQDGERLWDGVFTQGVPRTRLWRGLSTNDLVAKIAEQRARGYELADVEVYSQRPGVGTWAGLFEPSEEDRTLIQDRTIEEFRDVWERLVDLGHRLIDVEKYEGPNGERWFAGLFVRGSGGHALDLDVAPEDVDTRRNDFAREGLRIVEMERYTSGANSPRWALVAGPVEGNSTSRIDKTFCGTWNGPFTGFWETHQDLTRQGRALIDFERYPAPEG